jgi:hypothetical protein
MKRLALLFALVAALATSLAFGGVAQAADRTLARVSSSYMPLPGQEHRSSGNFSTTDAPGGTRLLCFVVSNNSHAGSIHFKVKEDRRHATDPTIFGNVVNGACLPYHRSSALYIADPSGAGGHNFTVTVVGRT